MKRRHVLALAGALVLIMASACEPESFAREVEYINKTEKEIIFYQDSTKQFDLMPGDMRRGETIVGVIQLSFEARDKTGRVIFQLKTTPKELEKMGWRIVITDQTLTPTPTPGAKPP